jgi:hypothetical protein
MAKKTKMKIEDVLISIYLKENEQFSRNGKQHYLEKNRLAIYFSINLNFLLSAVYGYLMFINAFIYTKIRL